MNARNLVFFLGITLFLHCQNVSTANDQAGSEILLIHGASSFASRFNATTGTFAATAALPTSAAAGANSFKITAGVHSGKVLIVVGANSNATYLYDISNGTYSLGPVLPVPVGADSITFSNRDIAASGKQVLVVSGATLKYAVYDPAANAWGPAINAGGSSGALFSMDFQTTLGSTQTYVAVKGGGASLIYDPETLTTENFVPNILPYGNGAQAHILKTGPNAGSGFMVTGNLDPLSILLSNAGGTILPLIAIPIAGPLPGDGASSFLISSGALSGKILIVHGAGTTNTSVFDPAGMFFMPGPTLPAAVNTGGCAISVSAGLLLGKTIIIHGGNTAITSIYDPSVNTFSTGTVLPASVNAGAHTIILN